MSELPATVPTEDELQELPQRARVAFAARCARRVFPRFDADWPDAPPEHRQALLDAIQYAETVATRGKLPKYPSARIEFAAGAAADAAAYWWKNIADDAADATWRAVCAIISAEWFAKSDGIPLADAALTSVGQASSAVNAAVRADPTVAESVREDFQVILAVVRACPDAGERYYPPELFGPLSCS